MLEIGIDHAWTTNASQRCLWKMNILPSGINPNRQQLILVGKGVVLGSNPGLLFSFPWLKMDPIEFFSRNDSAVGLAKFLRTQKIRKLPRNFRFLTFILRIESTFSQIHP
ncbi:unnamed protein product [Dovyalis caffra]|uniref:Uncharacterized protein n=1 Tax=Dovyalis caffra TaxID=77055 RepID=A0AAV1R0M9_9ROSI|nr:unnamed protein product [Dovyalis caffra]